MTNSVRLLRATLLLVTAVMVAVSLVAMHSVVTSASSGSDLGEEPSVSAVMNVSANASVSAAMNVNGPDAASVELCPCPGGSDSSAVMTECTSVATLGGPVAVAALRAECAELAPVSPRAAPYTGTLAPPTAPSLFVLSISRT